MKILQLSHKPPFPVVDGGTLAMHALTKGLQETGAEVRVFCLETHKHPLLRDQLSQEYQVRTRVEAHFVDTRIKPHAAFLNLFSGKSYNLSRFYHAGAEQKLRETLKQEAFDVIQLESLFMAPYISAIRAESRARVILRAHNVEYLIWERLARETGNPLKKAYLSLLASRLKREEINYLNQIDGLLAITNNDLEHFRELGYSGPAVEIPVGIDTDQYRFREEQASRPVAYLGSLDWPPNQEGVKWMLDKVLPEIRKSNQDLTVAIAGRNAPTQLAEELKNHPGVHFIGEVPNAAQYMQSAQVLVVPVLSGSGMRVRLVEAMALGVPVVTTTIGAEGLPITSGSEMIIADDPANFASTVIELLKGSEKRDKLARLGRKMVEENFKEAAIASRLLDFYHNLV